MDNDKGSFEKQEARGLTVDARLRRIFFAGCVVALVLGWAGYDTSVPALVLAATATAGAWRERRQSLLRPLRFAGFGAAASGLLAGDSSLAGAPGLVLLGAGLLPSVKAWRRPHPTSASLLAVAPLVVATVCVAERVQIQPGREVSIRGVRSLGRE